MLLSKAEILGRSLKIEKLHSEILGDEVCVREFPSKEFIKFAEQTAKLEKKGESADARERLIVLAICDEEGKPLFSKEDLPALRDQANGLITELYDLVAKVNRLGKSNAVEEAVKNSNTPQEDSSFD